MSHRSLGQHRKARGTTPSILFSRKGAELLTVTSSRGAREPLGLAPTELGEIVPNGCSPRAKMRSASRSQAGAEGPVGTVLYGGPMATRSSVSTAKRVQKCTAFCREKARSCLPSRLLVARESHLVLLRLSSGSLCLMAASHARAKTHSISPSQTGAEGPIGTTL